MAKGKRFLIWLNVAHQLIMLKGETANALPLCGFFQLACNLLHPASIQSLAEDTSHLIHQARVLKINIFYFSKLFQ